MECTKLEGFMTISILWLYIAIIYVVPINTEKLPLKIFDSELRVHHDQQTYL